MKRLAMLMLPLVCGACWPAHHPHPTVGYPPTSVVTWGVQAPGDVELNVGPPPTTTTFLPVASIPTTPDTTTFVPPPFPVFFAPQPVFLPPPYPVIEDPTTTTTELPTTTTTEPPTTTTTAAYPTPPHSCWTTAEGNPACA